MPEINKTCENCFLYYDDPIAASCYGNKIHDDSKFCGDWQPDYDTLKLMLQEASKLFKTVLPAAQYQSQMNWGVNEQFAGLLGDFNGWEEWINKVERFERFLQFLSKLED